MLSQKRQQLLRNRNDTAGGRRFRCFDKAAVSAVLFAVVTTFIYGNLTFCKIDVRPLKREQFPDAQPGVKTKHDSEHLRTPVGKYRCFDFFLLLYRKTLDLLFRRLRAFYLIGSIFRKIAETIRHLQSGLYHRDDRIYRIGGQSAAGPKIAMRGKFRYHLL